MEEPTNIGNGPSGRDFYLYKDNGIVEYNSFIYEVSLHKYWKNGYCLLGTKLFKSNKFIDVKKTHIYKKFKDYMIEKDIILIAAPYEFIREKNLKVYKPIILNTKKHGRQRKVYK